MPPRAPFFPHPKFYEPVELHVIIQSPLTFQKDLIMVYVFLRADPLGGE